MSKKIFIICKVRLADAAYKVKLEEYVSLLEKEGNIVHFPHRDTNQNARGINICKENMNAIKNTDEIHVFYSSASTGIHFDLGVAFSLNKKIKVIANEEYGPGKSFMRMLIEWEEEYGN